MPESNLDKPVVISGALLAAYTAIVAWLFYEQTTSWPHVGSYTVLAYLLLCPGIVFQAFNLAWMGVRKRVLTRRVLTRLVTIPLGLVLAAALGNLASEQSMSGFVSAYAPLVAKLDAGPAAACAGDAKYFELPGIAEYNRGAERVRPGGMLKHGVGRYVLAFRGGSMDIDGSTIYYDSRARSWTRFHNNSESKAAALAKLTDGLSECKVAMP